MSTLYVDVDDTLVRWLDPLEGRLHPYGAGATGWEPNRDVVQLVRWWNGPVVVWSGGGADYAEGWAATLLPHVPVSAFHDKFPLLPSPGDVCIDDCPFPSFASHTIHPKNLEGIAA